MRHLNLPRRRRRRMGKIHATSHPAHPALRRRKMIRMKIHLHHLTPYPRLPRCLRLTLHLFIHVFEFRKRFRYL